MRGRILRASYEVLRALIEHASYDAKNIGPFVYPVTVLPETVHFDPERPLYIPYCIV